MAAEVAVRPTTPSAGFIFDLVGRITVPGAGDAFRETHGDQLAVDSTFGLVAVATAGGFALWRAESTVHRARQALAQKTTAEPEVLAEVALPAAVHHLAFASDGLALAVFCPDATADAPLCVYDVPTLAHAHGATPAPFARIAVPGTIADFKWNVGKPAADVTWWASRLFFFLTRQRPDQPPPTPLCRQGPPARHRGQRQAVSV